MPLTLIKAFDVTIPAGTPKLAPVTRITRFDQGIVTSIEWLFPEGCQGMVGIQLGSRSVSVLPNDPTQFYVRSGSAGGVQVEEMHNTGDWSVIGYNTGTFDHTIHVTYRAHRIPTPPKPETFIVEAWNYLGTGAS